MCCVIVIAARIVYSLIDLINNVANNVRIVVYSQQELLLVFRTHTHTHTHNHTHTPPPRTALWESPGHRGILTECD